MPGQRADVKELKARLDIVSILSRYVTLIKTGTGFKAKCPFHKDDTPSMTVSADKGLWHCFGCGEGGDVIGFVMKIERLTFIETVRRLAEEVGMSFEASDDGSRDELRSLMADVANAFARNLRSDAGQKARDYLMSRGYPESCWLQYGFGYALPGWDHIKKAFSRRGEEALLTLGLLVKGDRGTYDRFRDRTIFPILDLSGRPVGFGGRTFDGEPKYLNSPQTPLFDKGRLVYGISWARDRMSETRVALLVEGYTDVLSLHQAGITNAVGSMGTSLTQGQADLLKRFVEEVVICYDQDAAGSAASLRGMQILYNNGLNVRVASLPAGEDPDGYVRAHGAEAMQKILDEALPFHRFFIESLQSQHDVSTIRGKRQLLEDAREFYGSVRSSALREEIDDKISDLLDLSVETVRRELPRRPKSYALDDNKRPVEEWNLNEDDILTLVLRGDLRWEEISSTIGPEDFSEVNRPIVRCLQSGLSNLEEILDELDEEGARRASFYALNDRPINREIAATVAVKRISQMRAIESRLQELDTLIDVSAKDENWELWNKLAREKSELRIALGRAKYATGEGIHEQQSQEGRSESEVS